MDLALYCLLARFCRHLPAGFWVFGHGFRVAGQALLTSREPVQNQGYLPPKDAVVEITVNDVKRWLGDHSGYLRSFMGLVAFTVYAPLIAIASLFVRPKWKGRRV